MNATILICTKLSPTQIHTTYVNLEGEGDPYILGITLSEPPWRPVGNPRVPVHVGDTAVTVHRHDQREP